MRVSRSSPLERRISTKPKYSLRPPRQTTSVYCRIWMTPRAAMAVPGKHRRASLPLRQSRSSSELDAASTLLRRRTARRGIRLHQTPNGRREAHEQLPQATPTQHPAERPEDAPRWSLALLPLHRRSRGARLCLSRGLAFRARITCLASSSGANHSVELTHDYDHCDQQNCPAKAKENTSLVAKEFGTQNRPTRGLPQFLR